MIRPRSVFALSWLIAFAACLPAQEAENPAISAYAKKSVGRQAYGLYLYAQNIKIGWEISETKLGQHEGKSVCITSEEAFFELNRSGDKLTLEVKSTTRYSLAGNGEIIDVMEESKENGKVVKRKGARKGDAFRITVTNPSGTTERSVSLPKKTLALSHKLDEWMMAVPAKGAKFEAYTLSLEDDDINTKEQYTFLEKKTIAWGGVPTDIFHVSMLVRGLKSEADVKSDGTPIRAKLGGFLEIRAEPEATAKKLDSKGIDLMALSSIEADKNLGNPAKVEELLIEIKNVGDYKMPESHRQKLKKDKDGKIVLELKKDFRVDKSEPLSKEERATMLKATNSVQSDNPKLREKAKTIVGDEKDPVEKAKKIKDWVYKNMKQTMAANASTSLEVLDQLAGDCTEHALLFTALARAADVPAREVGGVAFVPLGKPLFGWHAWAEIHDGKQWISVDPTWNQFMVDATHIKFSEDPDDMAWLNVLGEIKFKIVDYKKK